MGERERVEERQFDANVEAEMAFDAAAQLVARSLGLIGLELGERLHAGVRPRNVVQANVEIRTDADATLGRERRIDDRRVEMPVARRVFWTFAPDLFE